MKNHASLTIILTLFILMGNIIAQPEITEADLKSALSTIIDQSVKEDFAKAANLMLFDGTKEKRAFNSADISEMKTVKRLCKKIKAYIDLSDSYEYNKYTPTNIDGLPGSILDVSFKSGDQKLNISFSFVKLSGKILLVSFK